MQYREQLSAIMQASGWSQEELAHRLGVSFATLNAWLRERAEPRKNALLKIERLYLDIVGAQTIDTAKMTAAKSRALLLKTTVAKLVRDAEQLDTLTLYLTYHTNTIEGSTMTLADVEEVIFEHKVLANRTAVEQAEARNHQAALNWTLEQLARKTFTVDAAFIKGVHLRLMNGIVSDAGQYRRHSVRIMGARVTVANWAKIPDLITALTAAANDTSPDVVGQLAQIHADFEKIHPFSDGNGRTGRLLLLAMALKAGLVPPVVAKERKYAYYKYLEMAQMSGLYAPLELFVAEAMEYAGKLLNEKNQR